MFACEVAAKGPNVFSKKMFTFYVTAKEPNKHFITNWYVRSLLRAASMFLSIQGFSGCMRAGFVFVYPVKLPLLLGSPCSLVRGAHQTYSWLPVDISNILTCELLLNLNSAWVLIFDRILTILEIV